MSDLVLVKLLKRVPPYNPGEEIGVQADVAERYIRLKVAVEVKDTKPKPPVRQVATVTRQTQQPARKVDNSSKGKPQAKIPTPAALQGSETTAKE